MEFTYDNVEEIINEKGVVKVIFPRFEGCERINCFYSGLCEEFLLACKRKSGRVFARMKSEVKTDEPMLSVKTVYSVFVDGERESERAFTLDWDKKTNTICKKKRTLSKNRCNSLTNQ